MVKNPSTVLMLPGFLGSIRHLKVPLAVSLTEAGHTVYILSEYHLHRYPHLPSSQSWASLWRHKIGLGSVVSQARKAYQYILSVSPIQGSLYLVGHSQGALVALTFWEQYHTQIQIGGVVTLSGALRGVAPLGVMGPTTLQMVPGISDMHPQSVAIRKVPQIARHMQQEGCPLLTITAHLRRHAHAQRGRHDGLLWESHQCLEDRSLATSYAVEAKHHPWLPGRESCVLAHPDVVQCVQKFVQTSVIEEGRELSDVRQPREEKRL